MSSSDADWAEGLKVEGDPRDTMIKVMAALCDASPTGYVTVPIAAVTEADPGNHMVVIGRIGDECVLKRMPVSELEAVQKAGGFSIAGGAAVTAGVEEDPIAGDSGSRQGPGPG